jgi:hypothetical protein
MNAASTLSISTPRSASARRISSENPRLKDEIDQLNRQLEYLAWGSST